MFLKQNLSKDLLRFTTAGSVDDGKSTLIGRLLHDSKAVYEDQLASIKKSRINRSTGPIDFSLLTDGLRAEREQGITIDVGYRYFTTAKRKFIIADTPGHEQYTRNMATGASTADLAVILVDGSKGLLPQTLRHAYISSLLGIPSVLAAINKMDLVDFSEERFLMLEEEFYRACRAAWYRNRAVHPGERSCRRQRGGAQRANAVVFRPLACSSILRRFRLPPLHEQKISASRCSMWSGRMRASVDLPARLPAGWFVRVMWLQRFLPAGNPALNPLSPMTESLRRRLLPCP